MLEKYISQLLYRYDCIIIPEFGGFLTQKNSASFDPVSYEFYPPSKELRFNANLKNNDGLLIHYICQIENQSFDEVSNLVRHTIKEWKTDLAEGKELVLNHIGVFLLNEEGNLVFNPSEEVNYAKDSFGLTPVKAQYILREDEKQKTFFTWRKASMVAAGIALFAFIGTVGYTNKDQVRYQMANMINASALEDVRDLSHFISHDPSLFPQPYQAIEKEEVIEEIHSSDKESVEQTKVEPVKEEVKKEPNVTTPKKEIGRYQLIGGAFKSMENAKKRLHQLKKQGFKNAQILGVLSGMTIVSYDTYTNHAEAQKEADRLQAQGKEVWLRIKN